MLLSFACRRPKLVPVTTVTVDALDIYCWGLLGMDWSSPRGKGQSHRNMNEKGMRQCVLKESKMTQAAGQIG